MANRVADFYKHSVRILEQYIGVLACMDQRRMDAWTSMRSGQSLVSLPEGIDETAGGRQYVAATLLDPPRECFLAFMPGVLFLQRFLAWARLLRWPQPLVPAVHSHQCISQFELILNLLLCTQEGFPRITGRGPGAGQLCYLDPCQDPLALMIPLRMQKAVKLFQHTVLYLDKFRGVEAMPKSVFKQAKMLCWLGNKTVVSGYSTRPLLPYNDIHNKLVLAAFSESGITIPHIPKVERIAHCSWPCDFPNLDSQDLFRNYKQLYRSGRQ